MVRLNPAHMHADDGIQIQGNEMEQFSDINNSCAARAFGLLSSKVLW